MSLKLYVYKALETRQKGNLRCVYKSRASWAREMWCILSPKMDTRCLTPRKKEKLKQNRLHLSGPLVTHRKYCSEEIPTQSIHTFLITDFCHISILFRMNRTVTNSCSSIQSVCLIESLFIFENWRGFGKQPGHWFIKSRLIPPWRCSLTSNETLNSHLILIPLYRLTHHGLQYLQYRWCPFFFCHTPKHS